MRELLGSFIFGEDHRRSSTWRASSRTFSSKIGTRLSWGDVLILLDLKGRVLNAIMQMRGYEGLNQAQIHLARHLMLANVK